VQKEFAPITVAQLSAQQKKPEAVLIQRFVKKKK